MAIDSSLKKNFEEFYQRLLPFLNKQSEDSGSGGHTIEDASGTELEQREVLQFGSGFTVSDDDTNEKTVAEVDTLQSGDMADVVTPLPSIPARHQKYSTSEQVIGQWLDGKPLYQKTYSFSFGTITDKTNSTVNISIDQNVEKVVNVFGYCNGITTSGLIIPINSAWDGSGTIYYLRAATVIDSNNHKVSIYANRDLFSNQSGYVTIQYTKTTDPSGDGHIYQGRINDILSAADDSKVTASSLDTSEVPAWKAFDGKKGISSGTYASPYYAWLAGNRQAPTWLRYHFTEQKWIRQIDVYLYCNNGTYTGAIKIQASNDGTNWTDISVAKSVSIAASNEIKYSLSCDETDVWSYVRLYSETALAVHYGASVFVGEMEIYGGTVVQNG